MKLMYLKSWALTELRKVALAKEDRYASGTSWLDQYFAGRPFLAESKVEIKDLPALKNPISNTELFELENTIAIHGALHQLNRSQASDDRLWSWLAHGPYWSYMHVRWPVAEAKNKAAYVKEHYFVGDSRSLVRHGIARLWWFGQATYSPGAEDPYWLTRVLLTTTDARQSVMERQFWRNNRVLHPFLERVSHWVDNKIDLMAPRERFRDLCKAINLFGGSRVLDTLAPGDIQRLVDQYAGAVVPPA